MKAFAKTLVIATTVLSLTGAAFAATASGTATAHVFTPIAIANTAGLDFGSFAAMTGGTVVVADGTRTKTGFVVLSTNDIGNVSNFNVTGDNSATYAITLPADGVTILSGANSMVLNTFTSTAAAGTMGTLSALGAQSLRVGATLVVASGQAPGDYTGTFDVSVEYN